MLVDLGLSEPGNITVGRVYPGKEIFLDLYDWSIPHQLLHSLNFCILVFFNENWAAICLVPASTFIHVFRLINIICGFVLPDIIAYCTVVSFIHTYLNFLSSFKSSPPFSSYLPIHLSLNFLSKTSYFISSPFLESIHQKQFFSPLLPHAKICIGEKIYL